MANIESRLQILGLVLPPEPVFPADVTLPFPWVNLRENRAFVSGHGPQKLDGTLMGPFGKVGRDVTPEQAALLARRTGLSILASLKRELGDLDRILGWARVFGMVNSAPGFTNQPRVINGFSDLILDVFGPDVGRHARSAVGMAELPMSISVEIEAEVIFK